MSQVEKKYIGLIVEPDVQKRTRLKTAATAANIFETIDMANTFEESLAKLNLRRIDIVFFSGQVDGDTISAYLTNARNTKNGKISAFISVHKHTEESSESVVAANMARGVDGILWEPFSVQSVVGTAAIADKIKALDALTKKRAAASMLLDEALYEIDEIGRSTLNGDAERSRIGMQKLKKTGSDLKSFANEAGPMFREMYKERLASAQAQTLAILRHKYGGVSARVQKMLDRKKAEEEQKAREAATEAASV